MGFIIPESLVHFIWQFKLFDESRLRFTDGTPVTVLSPGSYHRDSGPDFRNAKLKTVDTLWVGNIEIHIRSSDWFRHNHDDDGAYDSVIAHVVITDDAEIHTKSGRLIPCIELNQIIPVSLFERYQTLMTGMFSIPCTGIGRVDVLTMSNWLDRLVVERLESRSGQVRQILESSGFDWQETLHVMLFRAFGMQVNQLPFEMLARIAPFSLLRKYSGSTFRLEAILLGCAGFLAAEANDEYSESLQVEFQYLKRKHRLKEMDVTVWKFLRMRPVNFPTIRIAQLAAFYTGSMVSPSMIGEVKSIEELKKIFRSRASPYWDSHYRLGETSAVRPKQPGKLVLDSLLINAVIPMMFEYANHRANAVLRERCLEWLYDMQPENNAVIREWSRPGIQPDSAAASQALLQLKRNYCDNRRCLDCALGHKLLKDTLKINSDDKELSF